jgi:hypothetical protein
LERSNLCNDLGRDGVEFGIGLQIGSIMNHSCSQLLR